MAFGQRQNRGEIQDEYDRWVLAFFSQFPNKGKIPVVDVSLREEVLPQKRGGHRALQQDITCDKCLLVDGLTRPKRHCTL